MSSVLEQIRSHHVDAEQLQQRIIHHLIAASSPASSSSSTTPHPPPTHLQILHHTAASSLLLQWREKLRRLLSLYGDDGDLLSSQLHSITTDTWPSFYSTLSTLRLQPSPPAPLPPPPPSLPPFTTEEAHGRHLDLTAFHQRYLNFPFHSRVDYLSYLSLFSSFPSSSAARRTRGPLARDYRLYIADLLDYLETFHSKTRPLVPTSRLRALMLAEFAAHSADTSAPAEEAKGEAPEAKAGEDPALYCPACRRYFAKATVFTAHLTGKRHVKAEAERTAASSAASALAREVVEAEWCVTQYAQLMAATVQLTVAFTHHKLQVSPSELAAEMKAAAPKAEAAGEKTGGGDEEEDDAAPIYNPLNLPLGWDGKPIPYWLYKLNGLNQTFACEICGGYVYAGPKVFREHFSQWRHAWGMRCLGVPNVKEFWHVTRMDEVRELWEKMKKEERKTTWREDEDEEMEDAEGNVFNKKTFLELQRQGLI